MAVDALSIVLAVSTALGAGGSAFLWVDTHTTGSRAKREKEIDSRVHAAVAPLTVKLDTMVEHSKSAVRNAIYEAMEPVKDQISMLNTKIDPLWKALEAQAIAAAQVLHQPDPRRAMIDDLLDKFMDGTITPDEEDELRPYLNKIKNWEPGHDIGFPVHPGEPTAAIIMLSNMELRRARKMREQHQS